MLDHGMNYEKARRFADKAKKAFLALGGTPGRPVYIGDYVIEFVPEAGVWVSDKVKGILVFSSNFQNSHANVMESKDIDDARQAFLRVLILEELADV
ncbi:MAG: hypothetical protein AB7L09_01615 [Nitrospira sp.]